MAERDEPNFSAKQSFSGSIDNVAGRDVINQNIQGLGRCLTKEERNALNSKVQELATKFDEPGWQTWKFLHRTIGVDNIEEMRIEHRDPANAIVDLILDNSKLKARASSTDQPRSEADTSHFERTIAEKDDRIFALSQLNRSLEGLLREKPNPRGMLRVIVALLLAIAGILGYKLHLSNVATQDALNKIEACHYGENSFSIGSTTTFNDKTEQACTSRGAGVSPEWKQVKATATPKAPQQKAYRRKKDNFDEQTNSDSLDDIN